MKGFTDILLLDRTVVLADLGEASFSRAIDFICFIGLDSLVMHPTLMLGHQDIVLLSLLLGFDLRVE